MAVRRRYAEGTTVPVTSSRAEITAILMKHGVEVMAWGHNRGSEFLQFELQGNVFRLNIERPTWADLRDRYVYEQSENAQQAAIDKEWRRRWRAQVLLLKAKLEFADGETSTVWRELMPYALLRDGTTLEQAITSGKMPLMLGTGE